MGRNHTKSFAFITKDRFHRSFTGPQDRIGYAESERTSRTCDAPGNVRNRQVGCPRATPIRCAGGSRRMGSGGRKPGSGGFVRSGFPRFPRRSRHVTPRHIRGTVMCSHVHRNTRCTRASRSHAHARHPPPHRSLRTRRQQKEVRMRFAVNEAAAQDGCPAGAGRRNAGSVREATR